MPRPRLSGIVSSLLVLSLAAAGGVSVARKIHTGIFIADATTACTVTTARTATLDSFTAPPEWQGAPSCQPPTLLANDLAAGASLKISNITGNLCGNGADCPGESLLPCASFAEVQIGFYSDTDTLVRENVLGSIGTTGVPVPTGATKAYLYYRDALFGREGYGNNVAYGCFVHYSITQASACSSSSLASSANAPSTLASSSAKADVIVGALGPASIVRGRNAVFSVTVRNGGGSPASNIVVSFAALAPFVYDPGLNADGCTLLGTALQCPPFDLAPGASRPFAFAYRTAAAGESTCSAGPVTATASATTATTEQQASNNSAAVRTEALCGAAQSSNAFSVPNECRASSAHSSSARCARFCLSDGGACKEMCGYDLSSLTGYLCPGSSLPSLDCSTIAQTPEEATFPRVTCRYQCCTGASCTAASSAASGS